MQLLVPSPVSRGRWRPDAQALADASLTDLEDAFQVRVLELAERLGYQLRYHPHDSRLSAPGFPDLTLVRPHQRLVFLELKVGRRQATPEQLRWLDALDGITRVDAVVARDSRDWTALEDLLR